MIINVRVQERHNRKLREIFKRRTETRNRYEQERAQAKAKGNESVDRCPNEAR